MDETPDRSSPGALKRQLSDVFYRRLIADQRRREAARVRHTVGVVDSSCLVALVGDHHSFAIS
jgi:hypothetical protein